MSLAAAWDGQVIKDLSKILISEAKSKEVDVLLGPTGKSTSVTSLVNLKLLTFTQSAYLRTHWAAVISKLTVKTPFLRASWLVSSSTQFRRRVSARASSTSRPTTRRIGGSSLTRRFLTVLYERFTSSPSRLPSATATLGRS